MNGGRRPWFVLGADSSIGEALLTRLLDVGVRAEGSTRRRARGPYYHLDLEGDSTKWMMPPNVDVAFLCAAIASVERCQEAPAKTRFANVERTLLVAERLRAGGAHLVFLSTNQVFDGERPQAPPDAPPSPRTEYGRQKAEAEQAILAMGPATIVRLTKVPSLKMKVLQTWTDALRRGEAIAPFRDMVMSPVPVAFVVQVLEFVGKRKPGGILHVSGDADVSYSEIACRLAARMRVSADLVSPVSFQSAGLPREMAPRHTTLDTTRLAEFGLQAPPVWNTIDAMIEGVIHE